MKLSDKRSWKTVEARLYTESMTGATANSTAVITKTGEKELEKLHRQDFWIRLQRIKLIMDLIFVCQLPPYFCVTHVLKRLIRAAYDLFKVRRARDTVRSFAGLTSALLRSVPLAISPTHIPDVAMNSSAKIYQNHWNSLLIKESQR